MTTAGSRGPQETRGAALRVQYSEGGFSAPASQPSLQRGSGRWVCTHHPAPLIHPSEQLPRHSDCQPESTVWGPEGEREARATPHVAHADSLLPQHKSPGTAARCLPGLAALAEAFAPGPDLRGSGPGSGGREAPGAILRRTVAPSGLVPSQSVGIPPTAPL